MKWWQRVRQLFAIQSPSLIVLGRTGSAFIALATAPIVARAIGPAGRGETAAAIALYVIVPVLLAIGLPLEVRRQAATSDGHVALRTARRIVALTIIIAAPLAVGAAYTVFSGFEPEARVVAAAGIFLAPLSASWALDVGLLVAHRRYRAVFAMQVLQPLVYLVLVVIAWLFGAASVASVLAANVIGSLTTFVLGAALVRVPWRGTLAPIGATLRAGFHYVGSAIAEAASNKLDQVIALPLLGAFQAGIYSVAATIASVPLAIGQALGASHFPTIAQADGDNRKGAQSEAARAGIAAGILSYVPAVALSVVIIPFVFGPDFVSAVPVTVVSLVGSAAMIAGYVISMALAADSKGIRMTIAQVISLGVGIGGLIVLGPLLGAIGAALASTLSYLVLLTILMAALKLPVGKLLPRGRDFVGVLRRLARD
ncbi:oligosaccharide flippase family protein [Agromyces albus]|uniref:Polysaccharide biosynthesis protein C-terminal domain-containing protein n=1 Tax=Agromyces albus TaxID=205332 RepID=A0A4Q2L6Z8_9MICO|nr:oligosaccharide flippase family protein [Agromyces albus]RXZ72222.1 hypothetical protein ESP51_04890 [Agromyces albus]